MSEANPEVWAQVQEAIYQRFAQRWVVGDDPRTLVNYDNDKIETNAEGPWVILTVRRRPGGAATIGRPGNRKMDRRGVVFVDLREPPGKGVKASSILSGQAAKIFEGTTFGPHDIRFDLPADVGREGQIDNGRWWGVTVECPFAYEELI